MLLHVFKVQGHFYISAPSYYQNLKLMNFSFGIYSANRDLSHLSSANQIHAV